MISAVAPRWPRAFSSIGLGACFLAFLLLGLGTAFPKIVILGNTMPTEISFYQALRSILGSVSGSSAVVAGFTAMFIAYIIGELLITASRVSYFSRRRELLGSKRRAKIALISNDFLTDSYNRRQTTVELMRGIFGLLFSGFAIRIVFVYPFKNWDWVWFLEFGALLLFSSVPYFLAFAIEDQIDQDIEMYENLSESIQ